MYRLTEDLANYLVTHMKNPHISVLDEGIEKPFTAKNLHSIGLIDPICALGTDFDYVLESPFPVIYSGADFPPPSVQGYWLYKKGELKSPPQPFLIGLAMIDPNARAKGSDAEIDVSDCAIVLPPDVEKLSATMMYKLENLLAAEPGLRECLVEEK